MHPHLRAYPKYMIFGLVLFLASAAVPQSASVNAAAAASGTARAQVATSSQWSVASSPGAGSLEGVSCVSTTDCVAVGIASSQSTLVESWDGSAWSVVPSPNAPGSFGNNYLNGVSCVSAASCIAVGDYYRTGPNPTDTLVESWNGSTWSIVPSPNPPGSQAINLSGVSCVSATSCVAVGSFTPTSDGPTQTLVESWDGSAWSVVPSADPGTGFNELSGVSCTGSTNCVAVGGDYATHQALRTLVESWDGSAWSVVPSQNVGVGTTYLSGVSCVNATNCVAVGMEQPGDQPPLTDATLVESWNGTSWSIVPSPNSAGYASVFNAVSCVSATACIAVGEASYYNTVANHGFTGTLVESWDGTNWSLVRSPSPDNFVGLSNVACTKVTSCVGVGDYFESGDGYQTLVESTAATVSSDTRLFQGSDVTVSASAGVFAPGHTVSIAECNPEITATNSNERADCDVSGSVSARVNADGSVNPTRLKVVTDQIGTSPQALCPPEPSQVSDTGSECVVSIKDRSTGLSYSTQIFFIVATTVAPSSGPQGTSVTLSGGGMLPDEVVTNNVVANKQNIEKLCSAFVGEDGTWSCTTGIGLSRAASYSVVGTGSLSHDKSKGIFTEP